MPIDLTCSCGKRLRVADEYAGQQGQCPVCGRALAIPDPRADFRGAAVSFPTAGAYSVIPELDRPAGPEPDSTDRLLRSPVTDPLAFRGFSPNIRLGAAVLRSG
jgi:hypothetical protein